MDEDPNNDVTPPCPDCGEVAIPCECGKPIETVAQLQRALEAAGVRDFECFFRSGIWYVALDAKGPRFSSCWASTLSVAIGGALDGWWEQEADYDD